MYLIRKYCIIQNVAEIVTVCHTMNPNVISNIHVIIRSSSCPNRISKNNIIVGTSPRTNDNIFLAYSCNVRCVKCLLQERSNQCCRSEVGMQSIKKPNLNLEFLH